MRNLLFRKPVRVIINIFSNLYWLSKYHTLDVGWNARILKGSSFEGYNKIGSNTEFHGCMGKYSYIGRDCVIDAEIGKFCSIGTNIFSISAAHPVNTFVSTHPIFYSTNKQSGKSFTKKQLFCEWKKIEGKNVAVIIGNDVFIGSKSIIIAGVKIGDGAIVGAGSVVTHDVEPYTIVAGNPARFIRKRFSDEEIDLIQNSEWWTKDEDWFRNNIQYMSDINKFKQLYL